MIARLALVALLTSALATTAKADGPPAAPPLAAAILPSKKELFLMTKALASARITVNRALTIEPNALPRVQGTSKKAAIKAPPVSIFNTWTREWIAVDEDGKTVADPQLTSRFLRCHFTNQPTQMDAQLLRIVVAAARHFKVDRVDVVSGFRHPKYNLMLRKKGREVARDSQHTHGNAIDFRLPGIAVRDLHRWAKRQRLGGVGLYLDSGFVHMDTGVIRYWGGQ